MSTTNTSGEPLAFARSSRNRSVPAPRIVQPAQGRPGWIAPSASVPSGPSRPGTARPVAAATHTAAFTAMPGGSASLTTTTHFSRAARVGALVSISSGTNPTLVMTYPAMDEVQPLVMDAMHSDKRWSSGPYFIRRRAENGGSRRT